MAETGLTSRGAAQPTREKLRVMYSAYWKTLSGIPATGGSVVFSQRRVSFRPCTDQRNVVKREVRRERKHGVETFPTTRPMLLPRGQTPM